MPITILIIVIVGMLGTRCSNYRMARAHEAQFKDRIYELFGGHRYYARSKLGPNETNTGTGAVMASAAMKQLKEQVLNLPEDERAELVHDVIASLDGPGDEGVEEAWAEEITRRIHEIRAGTVRTVDAAELMERIASRVRGTR